MDTQKLHDLIDKVIGKSGPLRTPAWWMRRVLRSLIDFINDVKNEVNDSMLKLESRLKALIANCIKSIPEYTYAELKELKDKGLLIPGQKYMMTDYRCTVSGFPDGLSGSYDVPALQGTRYIILTAITTSEFDAKALLYISPYLRDPLYRREILYCFERNDRYGWSLRQYEGFTIKVKKQSSQTTLILKYSRIERVDDTVFQNRGVYVTEDGADYGCIGYDIRYAFKNGATIPIYDTTTNTPLGEYYVLDIIDDSFKGVIYESKNPLLNITIPFDEYILFSFDVTTPESTHSIVKKPITPYSYSSLNGATKNIHIEPYIKGSDVYLPRIYISGGVSLSQQFSETSIYIAHNSTHIIVRGSRCHIGEHCSNIYLYYCSHALLVNNVVSVTIFNKYYVRISPLCSNLDVSGNGGDVIIGESNKNLKIISSSNIDIASETYQDDAETFTIDTSQKGTKLFVSKDSNGNIRCWNPADYVDAVTPTEEQNVEQTNVEEA